MTRYILLTFIVLFSFAHVNCSAIANAISALQCDEWLQQETSSDLNELCRELEGYVDTDTSTFSTSVSQVMPTNDIATTKRIYVLLTDSSGNPITTVDREDVTVEVSTDGGTTYDDVAIDDVGNLEDVNALQASLGMVIDYSGSVTDSDLADVNTGLDMFFDVVMDTDVSSVFQSAIIKFSEEVTVVQDFTSTKATLLTAVNDTSYTRTYTSMYDAIYDGVDEIKEETTSLNLLIVFTDGLDNDSTHTKTEAVSYAQDNDVPVCMVGVSFADVATLQEIAEDTGCFFIYKTFFTDLDLAFETLADQINGMNVIDLDDSFSETAGILKITIDVGEAAAREITHQF
ncbi:MAG: VWA domain-containing protein [bacterium]|nr:VWA domain-containing protein [bacterium]